MLLIMNIPMIGVWVRILSIPYRYLFPCILMLVCVGVYSVNNSAFDLMLVFVFTVIGFAMSVVRLSPAPMLLGIVLGIMMEDNLKRSMLLSRGDPIIFLERPISALLLGLSVAIIVLPLIMMLLRRLKNRTV